MFAKTTNIYLFTEDGGLILILIFVMHMDHVFVLIFIKMVWVVI